MSQEQKNVLLNEILWTLCLRIFGMNSLILLFFGILRTVYAVYKVPEHDACVLRVLQCDNFLKPLTPVDNSTLEMFNSVRQLNAVCEELSKFRKCLKRAANFCSEHSDLDVGFELLRNRKLAFDLCVRGSGHQHVYMMMEGCVNKFSRSAIDFCTDKAVETVGLKFSLGDFESECRFLGKMQHCHVAIVTDQCGSIAGSLLEKLVIFRGKRDFMCIGYENEKFKNLEAFYATMDSYVEQYRDRHYVIIREDGTEIIDRLKTPKILHEDFSQDRTSSKLQLRISPKPIENCASMKEYTSDNERPLSPKSSRSTKNPSCSCLSQQEILLSTVPQCTAEHSKVFYEQHNVKVLPNENFSCERKASFLLMGISSNDEDNRLGFGEADILWDPHSPLKDVSCAWIMNEAAPTPLFNCSIMIDDSVMVGEVCKRKMECDLPLQTILAVYETENEREVKRIAELRIHSFLKYPPTPERSPDKVINFFKKHEHDIRYSCSEQFAKQDPIHFTSRKGLMPSKFGMYDISERSEMFGQKYNFYEPEFPEYPIDTEIHLLSGNNLESEIETQDKSPPQNYEMHFFSDETFTEKDLDGPFTPYPSTSSSHSYRPYELFRPRMGEMLENGDQDLGMEDVPESDTGSYMLPFEDSIQKRYLDTEEMCPALPENVSKLINKFKKEHYRDMDHPLDIIDSDCHKNFQISEVREDVPLRNMMWKAGESEDISTDDQQNEYEDIYIVTTSAEMETTDDPDVIGYENAQSLEDGSPISNAKDYQNNKHSFLDEFAEASINHKTIPEEEEFSQKSKTFSKRSDKKYSIKIEEKFINAFEILAKIKIELGRMRKKFKEAGEKKQKQKSASPRKDEL